MDRYEEELNEKGFVIVEGVDVTLLERLYHRLEVDLTREMAISHLGKIEGRFVEGTFFLSLQVYDSHKKNDYYPELFDSIFLFKDSLNLMPLYQGIKIMQFRRYFETDNSDLVLIHQDKDQHFIAFKPIGESLELLVDEKIQPINLKQDQALHYDGSIPHGVRNLNPNKERYSITFSMMRS